MAHVTLSPRFESLVWKEISITSKDSPTPKTISQLAQLTLDRCLQWTFNEADLSDYFRVVMLPSFSEAPLNMKDLLQLIKCLRIPLLMEDVRKLQTRFHMSLALDDYGEVIHAKPFFTPPPPKNGRVFYTPRLDRYIWMSMLEDRNEVRRKGKPFKPSKQYFSKFVAEKGWVGYTGGALEGHWRRSMTKSLWTKSEFDPAYIIRLAVAFSVPITNALRRQLEKEWSIQITTKLGRSQRHVRAIVAVPMTTAPLTPSGSRDSSQVVNAGTTGGVTGIQSTFASATGALNPTSIVAPVNTNTQMTPPPPSISAPAPPPLRRSPRLANM